MSESPAFLGSLLNAESFSSGSILDSPNQDTGICVSTLQWILIQMHRTFFEKHL